MTRHLLVLAALPCLTISCDQKPAARQESAEVAAGKAAPQLPQLAPQTFAAADTAPPYRSLPGFGDSAQAPLRVSIGGRLYLVQASARVDSTQALSYTYPPEPGAVADSAESNTVTGYQGIYTFRLLRPDGQAQFVRELKNSDFKEAIGEGLAVEVATYPPVFTGYLPAFNALAFELSFNPPESDSGGQVLLLLDATTGRVIRKTVAYWNSGCNSPTALSPNGRTLLTSFEIIQANGRVAEIDNRPGRQVGGTLLVNDQTILVAYLPGTDRQGNAIPLKGPNAELMDLNGRRLASFRLMSIDGGLGYRMAAKYVGQTRTHYLLDEENRRLCLVSADHPSPVKTFKLSQLTKFKPPQLATEVRFHFDTETGTRAAFYADTLSGQLRYWFNKPAYDTQP